MGQLLIEAGVSAATASTVASVAAVSSAALGVAGAVQGNKEAKAQEAEFNRQAKEERLMASVGAERERRTNRQRLSSQRTAFVEGGAIAGTAQGVLEQNAVAQELDALTVEFQGEQRGQSAEFQAQQAGRGSSALNVFGAAVKGFNQIDALNVGN